MRIYVGLFIILCLLIAPVTAIAMDEVSVQFYQAGLAQMLQVVEHLFNAVFWLHPDVDHQQVASLAYVGSKQGLLDSICSYFGLDYRMEGRDIYIHPFIEFQLQGLLQHGDVFTALLRHGEQHVRLAEGASYHGWQIREAVFPNLVVLAKGDRTLTLTAGQERVDYRKLGE